MAEDISIIKTIFVIRKNSYPRSKLSVDIRILVESGKKGGCELPQMRCQLKLDIKIILSK